MKNLKSDKSTGRQKNSWQIVDQIPRRRLWLYRIIALLIIPVIFFTLLEAALRIFNFGYSSSALIESDNSSGYVHENSAFAYRFFPKSLAQEFVPLRFNAEKPKGVIRIFILGESAAQGIPDPAYSFGRILDVMLQLRYPDKKFEILPVAMTAINSHVILEIAKDCAKYDPDLFIAYMGNNEIIGPYGPGTMLTPFISNSLLRKLDLKFKETKINQLLTLGLEKLDILRSPYNHWKGMEMFLRNPVPLNDPRLQQTYENFSDNLEKLNQISNENNIKIIYSTLVSNLKDCPPFNSKHSVDLKSSDLQKWNELYSSGSALEEASKFNEAIAKYIQAEKIDNQYADLHFRLGRCYWQIGNFAESHRRYVLSREYDCSRFRADNRINKIIYKAASEIPGTTFLADPLSEIEQRTPHGVPGNEFLYEHVHLNFEGNYLVARTILNQIEHIFSDVLKDHEDKSIQITDSACAAYLAYNTFEQQRLLNLVLNGFFKQPPFTHQLYHSETVRHLERVSDSLLHIIQAQNPDQIVNSFEQALQKSPSDWLLHDRYADYLADDNVRKYQEAAEQYQSVINSIPHDPNAYVKRGVVLGKLGRLQGSLNNFQLAIKVNSKTVRAYFNSGLIYQKLNKLDLAVENYEKAVFYEPTYSKAYNNMAFILFQKGDISKAIEAIEQGLQAAPDDLTLNYNKALFLYQDGRKSEAVEQLRHLIRLAPNEKIIEQKLQEWVSKEKESSSP